MVLAFRFSMRAESVSGLFAMDDLAEVILGDCDLRELVVEDPEVECPFAMECVMVESYCKSGTGAMAAASRVPAVESGNARSSQERGIRLEEERVDQSVMSQKVAPEVMGKSWVKVDREEEEDEAGKEKSMGF